MSETFEEAIRKIKISEFDLCAQDLEKVCDYQEKKIEDLEAKLEEAVSLIDWLWEHEPNQCLMLDKIQEYLKEKEAQGE